MLHARIGSNVQGPSRIRVPGWVRSQPGRLELYFADHKGTYIRLACTERSTEPWKMHSPMSLELEDSCFPTEPPVSTRDALDRALSVIAESGVTLPCDPLTDPVTPYVASPDVHVDDSA